MKNLNTNRIKRDLGALLEHHRDKVPYVIAACVLLLFYIVSKGREQVTRVYHSEDKVDFKDARVLGSQGESLYEGKERLLSKTIKDLLDAQKSFKETTVQLESRLTQLEQGKKADGSTSDPKKDATANGNTNGVAPTAPGDVRVSSPPEEMQARQIQGRGESPPFSGGGANFTGGGLTGPRIGRGNGIISFPVKEVGAEKTTGVVIPPGSYVKAKVMTGVEAPEGKTYPVLLQLDYAYIVPNKKRLDLSGCFMIVKSQGDLSTERVQMQASKLSCVSQDGKMFERDVSGYVADDKDNSFAVMGSVNSKQDRVATMAFMSSVVEGVGKAIQQAQTTQSMNPLGGTSSIVTGSSMAYLGAGGASNAAGMVTQWYLQQAQKLLPTINIGSGQDVWVVMQETVRLPTDYFRKNLKGGSNEGVFTYFSRIGE
jgi:hypothetical protein